MGVHEVLHQQPILSLGGGGDDSVEQLAEDQLNVLGGKIIDTLGKEVNNDLAGYSWGRQARPRAFQMSHLSLPL